MWILLLYENVFLDSQFLNLLLTKLILTRTLKQLEYCSTILCTLAKCCGRSEKFIGCFFHGLISCTFYIKLIELNVNIWKSHLHMLAVLHCLYKWEKMVLQLRVQVIYCNTLCYILKCEYTQFRCQEKEKSLLLLMSINHIYQLYN